MHVGYALVNFRFRTCGFTRVAPDRFALWTRYLFKEIFCLLLSLSRFFFRWTKIRCAITGNGYLLITEMAICFHSITAMGLLRRTAYNLGASKPLVGEIPSDTCSAFRLCGVATKPPLQTFVFNRKNKTGVEDWWGDCCSDDAVVRLILST